MEKKKPLESRDSFWDFFWGDVILNKKYKKKFGPLYTSKAWTNIAEIFLAWDVSTSLKILDSKDHNWNSLTDDWCSGFLSPTWIHGIQPHFYPEIWLSRRVRYPETDRSFSMNHIGLH